ncbi:hypothetical protein SAMN04515665_108179 [Blastococcus sp. DSM 46786]|uniref:hypothetical protein n=1 Tax=Blastococcus sp. DSM 46786 TaxID=1798227 RepID=UPI0008BF90B7|nr:hypothetical protein [Blastococcus sp. DSM 46786]SEL13104.1 hypothetical protein SAMN04515665_108179 [Blastococcus sp. DSM 46786]
MGGDAGGFVGYPMVEESEATGAVAAVYAHLLDGMPFVPSLFKSLALCPGYLVLAHEQAAGVLPDPSFAQSAQNLLTSAREITTPPADADVRGALAGFTGPLSRMLLLAAGLRLALDGELHAPPAPGQALEARPVRPASPAPSPADAPAPELYGQIRAALDTPVVNSIWRSLADGGLLEAAWDHLGPQVPATRAAADDLQHRAVDAARHLPWQVVADPIALEQAGLDDARPGMAAVLGAYMTTLPRVLVLVASSSAPE